jgi:hypothetical protein
MEAIHSIETSVDFYWTAEDSILQNSCRFSVPKQKSFTVTDLVENLPNNGVSV